MVTVGAIAGAVTAVRALIPSDPEDSAEIAVHVLPDVLLTEYKRQLDAMRPDGFHRVDQQPSSTPTVSDPELDDTAVSDEPPVEASCLPTDTCEDLITTTGDGDRTSEPPTTSALTTEPSHGSGRGDFELPSTKTHDIDERVEAVMDRIPACGSEPERASCWDAIVPAVRLNSLDEDGNEVPPLVTVERTLEVLRDSRMSEQQEPIGALVTVSVVLTGLRDRATYLTWSMWPAAGGNRLMDGWFSRHLVYRMQPGTDRDSTTVDMWVPLPTAAGQYVIDVNLHLDDTRLAYTRSEPFG